MNVISGRNRWFFVVARDADVKEVIISLPMDRGAVNQLVVNGKCLRRRYNSSLSAARPTVTDIDQGDIFKIAIKSQNLKRESERKIQCFRNKVKMLQFGYSVWLSKSSFGQKNTFNVVHISFFQATNQYAHTFHRFQVGDRSDKRKIILKSE